MEHYYYLGLDVLSIAFPLLASFEPRLRFSKKWPGLFTGIAVMAAVFLAWDAIFTAHGVWSFNPRYLVGAYLFGLPVEEWLFFIVVPYSCAFLYEVMRHFVRKDVVGKAARPIGMAIITLLVVVGLLHLDKWYTTVTFFSTAAFLALHVFVLKSRYLGRFYVGYAVSLIPFFLINGILTGWLLPEPIVRYNDLENLGIRLNTIPIEDGVYLFFFLLLTITFYERPLERQHSGELARQ